MSDADKVHVICLYSEQDFKYVQELRRHLAPLDVALWGRDMITPGRSIHEAMLRELDRAHIIVLFLSADLLASKQNADWLHYSTALHEQGKVLLIPIQIRSSFRPENLKPLQFLPRDGRPIASSSSRDETWLEVAEEIAATIKFRPGRTASSGPHGTPKAPGTPVLPIEKIFPIFVDVRGGVDFATLVDPDQYQKLLGFLRVPGQGLVVEGPSGSGKSIAVRKALDSLGAKSPLWLQCSDDADLDRLDRCLRERASGYVVVDDFHYLDAPRKTSLARYIQAGHGNTKFVLIGVNEVRTSLVQDLPDLGRRVVALPMGRQSPEKLDELIAKGEAAANISFLHRSSFITEASGSLFLAQNLCYFAAIEAEIPETQQTLKEIAINVKRASELLQDNLRGEFGRHIAALVARDQGSPPRGATLILLWLLADDGQSFTSIDSAQRRFPGLLSAFDWLRENLSAGIRSIDHLSRYLHFDHQSGILTCQDPRLEFYLRNLLAPGWFELIRDTGHQHLQVETSAERTGTNVKIVHSSPAQTADTTMNAQGKGGLPRTLIESLQRGQVVPLAGAGVSMAVHDITPRDRQDPRLFPSWAALLEEAAQRLEQDGLSGDAMAVRGALSKRNPSYLEAARAAQEGLGASFFRLLSERFDPSAERVAAESLALPKALWRLGSKLIVTTNYDRVLQWTCPPDWQHDLRLWNIQAPTGMIEMLREGIQRPTLWHLHGHVDDISRLILTPDGYNLLYANGPDQESLYRAALSSLQILLAARTFLFVGFSFNDQRFGDQLRWVQDVFNGSAGPHYMIARESERDAVRERLRGLPVDVLTVPALGPPLLSLLDKMAEVAKR